MSLSLQYDGGIVHGQVDGKINSAGQFTPNANEFNFEFEGHSPSNYPTLKDWAVRTGGTAVARFYYGWTGTPFMIHFNSDAIQLTPTHMQSLGFSGKN